MPLLFQETTFHGMHSHFMLINPLQCLNLQCLRTKPRMRNWRLGGQKVSLRLLSSWCTGSILL